MPRSPSRDRAVSDVVGTILLIGIAVGFVAATAVRLAPGSSPSPPERLSMSAAANATAIRVLHQGGAPLDEGTLRADVIVNGSLVRSVAAGPPGVLWSIGSELVLNLSTPLPPGPAQLQIVHTNRSEVLATASVTMPLGSSGSSTGPVLAQPLLNGTATASVVAPGQVFVTVSASHPEGRKLVRYVSVNATNATGPAFVLLRDDGTHGDLVAGDSTWSGFLDVPLSSPRGNVTLAFTAVDLRGVSSATSLAWLNVS